MAQQTTDAARGGAPTIAQIAREVGVSVPTVSKVLNGRSDVAPATRAKVEEALSRHRYRRRRPAPPTPGVGLVDLVFHRLGSTWSMEIIRGVEQDTHGRPPRARASSCPSWAASTGRRGPGSRPRSPGRPWVSCSWRHG
jgi:IS30 family transposase